MSIISKNTKVLSSNSIRFAVSTSLEPIDKILLRCCFPQIADHEVDRYYEVAVSGGPDSLALALLSIASGQRVRIWHFDHEIRDSSAREAKEVEEFAQAIGAKFELVTQRIAPGPNLEARARTARRKSFPTGVATGHTMDDQAETFLINLMRGAGPSGLAAMRPSHAKPILFLRRSLTVGICNALALDPIHDESNASDDFLRNRVRHYLLPVLNEISQREITPLLSRTSNLLGTEDRYLDELASKVDPLDRKELRDCDAVLRLRALRQVISKLTGYPPSHSGLTTLSNYIEGSGNFRFQLAGNVDIVCRRNVITYRQL